MLTEFLIRIFIRDHARPELPNVRLSYGIFAGIVGIAINILLAILKFTIGILSGSIAISADAVNNLSDAGSSVVTVFGFKFSGSPADAKHPFGHGRLEYVASLIVSLIIVAVGFNFLKESVVKLFSPGVLKIDSLSLGILAGSLLFKFYLFLFYRKIGKIIDSKVLHAAAFDSLSDLLSTAVVIGAVFVSRFTTFPVDACAGCVVAALVIFGGIGIMRDTINPLLGELPNPELVEELRKKLCACKGIRGVHGIILHNYGPNLYFATAHAEMNREGDLLSVHDTLEAAEIEIARTMPVRLILHCDPFDTEDPFVKDWRAKMENTVSQFDRKFKLYDFAVEKNSSLQLKLRFHLLVPRNYEIPEEEILRSLQEIMRKYDPALTLEIEFVNAYV